MQHLLDYSITRTKTSIDTQQEEKKERERGREKKMLGTFQYSIMDRNYSILSGIRP